MDIVRNEVMPVRSSEDIVRVRQIVRQWATELKFSLVDQTKIVTAASELARNTLDHGGGGAVVLTMEKIGPRHGIRLVFEDKGPGIADVQRALVEGYSTGGGLGLGLSGARKLCNDFEVASTVGQGTRVMIARWK